MADYKTGDTVKIVNSPLFSDTTGTIVKVGEGYVTVRVIGGDFPGEWELLLFQVAPTEGEQ